MTLVHVRESHGSRIVQTGRSDFEFSVGKPSNACIVFLM